MRLRPFLLGLGIVIVLVIGAYQVMAAQSQKTGFDVVMESYGFELIDYQITDKFKFTEEHFTALDITVSRDNIVYHFYWIMKKERYNELKEKV